MDAIGVEVDDVSDGLRAVQLNPKEFNQTHNTPSASISRAAVRTPTYVKIHLQCCLDRRINKYMSVGGKRDRNACQVIDPPHSRRKRDGCHLHNINSSLANNVAPQYLIGLAIDNQFAKSEGLPINDSARDGVKVNNCCDNSVAFARFPFRKTHQAYSGCVKLPAGIMWLDTGNDESRTALVEPRIRPVVPPKRALYVQ